MLNVNNLLLVTANVGVVSSKALSAEFLLRKKVPVLVTRGGFALLVVKVLNVPV
jgi:hypothetical protein